MSRDTGETGRSRRDPVAPRRRTCLDPVAPRRRTCLDNPILAQHLDAIRALCREYGVLRLEVFESVCTPEFDLERSDVDFLVEYPDDYDYGPWASRVEDLRVALATLLGREVDLIMPRAIRKKYVLQSVNETRELLYAA